MKPYSHFLWLFLLFVEQGHSQTDYIKLVVPSGHSRGVNNGFFSRDSKLLATTGGDGVKIWDVPSGKLLHTLQRHSGYTFQANFNPDNTQIITMSLDKVIRLSDVSTGKLIDSLDVGNSRILVANFTPDGNRIVSVRENGVIKIWNAQSLEVLHEIHEDRNLSIAPHPYLSNDGKYLVTGFRSGPVRIWNTITGMLMHEWNAEGRDILFTFFSADAQFVVSTAIDSTIYVWNTETGVKTKVLKLTSAAARFAIISPDNSSIIYLSTDSKRIGRIRLADDSLVFSQSPSLAVRTIGYSLDGRFLLYISKAGIVVANALSGEKFHFLVGHTGDIENARFDPSGKYILSVSADNTANIWRSEDGKLIHKLRGFSQQLKFAEISPDGQHIVTGYDNNKVCIREATTGRIKHYLSNIPETQNRRVTTLSPDGQYFTTLSDEAHVSVWNISSGQLAYQLEGHLGEITAVDFSPDGKHICTASRDHTARLYDAKDGRLIQVFEGHEEDLFSVDFHPDGHQLVTASADRTTKIWDIDSGALRHSLSTNVPGFYYAQYSPDGKYIITYGASSNSVSYWDSKTGKLSHQYNDLLLGASLTDMSRDGKWVAFIQQDHTVIICDIVSGRLVSTLDHHTAYVNSAFFSLDGKAFITVSMGGDIQYWLLDQGKPVERYNLNTNQCLTACFSPDGQTILSTSMDGSFNLWDVKSITLQLICIDLDPEDWVVMHPSGLFDASQGAMEKMHWIKSLEVIDFSQIKMRYWEPDLFEKVRNKQKLRSVQGLNEYKSPPEVDLEVRDGHLHIFLKKRDGGYGRVAIFINGKEINADARGGQKLESLISEYHLEVSIGESPFLLQGEENIIKVVPWSEDGFASGRGAEVVYKKEGKKIETPPSFYAVICGVSEYHSSNIQLRYAEPDARKMADAIRMGAERLFGADRTFIFTHTSPGTSLPSKENIRSTFQKIKEVAQSGDILMLYLSGHGITYGGEYGDFYFLTSDAFNTSAETYADQTIRMATTISTKEFTEWINEIPALKQVMIIDACGSGKAVENLIASRDVEPSQIRAIDRMKDRTGMFIISGCAADAVSYEASRYGQGLLTYALLQAMKGAALREDKYVDVNSLFSFARETVPQLAAGIGGIQEPQMLVPKGGSFDIGLLDEAEKGKIKLSAPRPVFVRSNFINSLLYEDNLNLSRQFDDRLNGISNKGNELPIIYIDAREYPDGCKVSGAYYEVQNQWILRGKLKCGSQDKNFELRGMNGQELVQLLVDKVIDLADEIK